MRVFLGCVFLVLAARQTTGVIYRVNATEHDRMPDMVSLDHFNPCIREVGGLYCTVDIKLVSDQPSELLDLVRNYSQHLVTHYDHSVLHYGICVTQTCRQYLNNSDVSQFDVHQAVEACLNDTLWEKYQLKGLVDKDMYCTKEEDLQINLDIADIVVAIMLFTIIMLNLIGSAYDIYCTKKETKHRNRLLMSFSLINNWKRLVAPAANGPDFRLKRLKGLNGIKSFSASLVIMAHSVLPFVIAAHSTFDFEEIFHNILYHIILNGTMIVQTFFIMAGLLLSLNSLIFAEKRNNTWGQIPKKIMHRYIRLTPPYAVVLAFMSTLFKYIGSGPFWKKYAEIEIVDCRQYWYLNLLYANNYINEKQCMAHTWYLAADMQLFVVGLIFCTALTTKKSQKIGVLLLLLLGIIIPGVITYVNDLDALLIVSPETARKIFVFDDTFNYIYKCGHTNLAGYAVGLGVGHLVYYLLTFKYEETKKWFQKMRIIIWLSFPTFFAYFLTCSIFYIDGPPLPVIVRSLFGAFLKPIFGVTASFLIMGMIFKGERVYRGVTEWRGFTATGRISYCAFLIHISVIRGFAGTTADLHRFGAFRFMIVFMGTVIVTFLFAVPLYLMVESSFNEVLKIFTSPAPRKETNFEKNVVPKNVELVLELTEDSKRSKNLSDGENL